MKLLLDTHTLLWFVLGDASLSARARQLIEDPTNSKFVSPATYWELAIKIGKITSFFCGVFPCRCRDSAPACARSVSQ